MAITKTLNREEKGLLKKVFSNRGTKKDCAVKKKVNRDTISDIIDRGRGTTEVVNKIIEYANEYNAA